ncbi:DUF803-domain-containing protein [Schizopora paradoxa]|uniref:DUF803-domain-containing protein n=1 Tax=Schizopora paradoxa TaxID=27342 RepID=A0A0H2S2J0_9AGAM|nr:DUF803-domain-containing protein [Schizopora paradoxa]
MNELYKLLKVLHLLRGDDDSPLGGVISASFIGIIVAISGNVLISLALNCQKLAHKRLAEQKEERKNRGRVLSPLRRNSGLSTELLAEDSEEEGEGRGLNGLDDGDERVLSNDEEPHIENALLLETEPLLFDPWAANGTSRSRRGSLREYGTHRNSGATRPGVLQRLFPSRGQNSKSESDRDLRGANLVAIPAEIHTPNGILGPNNRRDTRLKFVDDNRQKSFESHGTEYLKSKLWWLGFSLMNVGELGNFISYAFAPASVVAPLGTFALIANCFFAPLMLREKFRKRDLIGVALAILGAVTVVLSANPSDTRLTPAGLIQAIKQPVFIAFTSVYILGAITFVGLSFQKFGYEHVFVDVGACALFGGFTVLSTKAFSSLLTLEWWGVITEWITYPILLVLIGTGVGQIMFLNRALMKFDSKIVIPTQFVLFTLSAIVGSAVLYGDFRSMTLHQLVTFGYGCGATFAGVFMLTWGAGVEPNDEDSTSNAAEQRRDGSVDRGRAHIILPTPRRQESAKPILRGRASTLSLVGFSPAQRVLLVRTPPTNEQLPLPRLRAQSVSSDV